MPKASSPKMASRQVNGHPPRKDWTQGGIVRNLLLLSWPVGVHESFYMGSQFLDMVWIGRMGKVAPIAGLGAASIVVQVGNAALRGFVTGARAVVARFVGTGDDKGANHAASQGLIINAVFGVIMAAAGSFLAEPILRLLGLEADVVAQGTAYMRIIFAGWAPYALWIVAFGVLQASGDTVTPMRITIFIRSVWIVLDPILIFGWWVFPRLGIGGAALAQVISQILAISLALWVFFSGRTRLRLTWRGFRPDLNMMWRIVKISIPAAVMDLQRAFGNALLTRLMAAFGTLAVAGHSMVARVEQMISPVQIMLGRGTGVLVGQNLGAGQPGRAERSSWLAVGFLEVFQIACSIAIWLWAENIVRIFNSDPALVELTSIFLRIAVAGYLVESFTSILQQAIAGAGDTIPPMLISLVMIWLVQLPLAFLLPRVAVLGVLGVRWAIVAGLVVGAIAYVIYFQMGRWKHKKV
ncbi:MAG: MATE family efflux transporter [Chloroflexi bacterium]|nr:MATE family efflux transporter [Chloroflexota bacterium]